MARPRKTALDKVREERALGQVAGITPQERQALLASTAFDDPVEVIVPKKRGRKPKNLTLVQNEVQSPQVVQETKSAQTVELPKRRGRRPKDISSKLEAVQPAAAAPAPIVEMPKQRKKPGPKPKNLAPIVAADVAPPKPATHNVVPIETTPSDMADNVHSDSFKRLLQEANQRSLYDLDWWFQIPKKERYRPGDVVYDTRMDRFGIIVQPARKPGLMRTRLLKVGSKTELYTRDWFLKLEDLSLVKRSDKLAKGFAETEGEYLRRSGRTLKRTE